MPDSPPEPSSPPEPTTAVAETLTSTATFDVVAGVEALATIELNILPSFMGEGNGRIEHPFIGAFDYEVKPDEWVNIDKNSPVIMPMWASSQTLTSTANTLWLGDLKDVVIEERWTGKGGISMPITQLRMLMTIWTTPIDPDVGYVHWYPNYITQMAFKVLPLNLTVGGQGIALDDVSNYKDEDGEHIGWATGPVVLTLKLVGLA